MGEKENNTNLNILGAFFSIYKKESNNSLPVKLLLHLSIGVVHFNPYPSQKVIFFVYVANLNRKQVFFAGYIVQYSIVWVKMDILIGLNRTTGL